MLSLKAPSGPSAGLNEPNAAPPGRCPVSTQSGWSGTNEKAGLTQQKQMQKEKQSQVCKKEEEKKPSGKGETDCIHHISNGVTPALQMQTKCFC